MTALAVLAFAATVAAAPASQYAALVEWAPPESVGAILFAHLDGPAALLDEVEARYGSVEGVAASVARLRSLEYAGLRPLGRGWGAGLAPARGAALFGTSGHLRVVVGARDAAAAVASLGALVQAIHPTARVTADTIEVGDDRLVCAGRGGYLVCDSAAVPDTPPGPPEWLAPPADAAVFLVAREGSDVFSDTEAIRALRVSLSSRGRITEVDVRADLTALGVAALHPLGAAAGPPRGLATIDSRSLGALRLSLDPSRVMPALGVFAASLPPEAGRVLLAAVAEVWSGDVVLSTAGGPLRPVLALGVRDGQPGASLVEALAATLRGAALEVELIPPSADTPGRIVLGDAAPVPLPDGQPEGEAIAPLRLAIPFALSRDALVLGLSGADVTRAQRATDTAHLPASFRARGVHSAMVYGPTMAVALPFLPGLVRVRPDAEGTRGEGANARLVLDSWVIAGVVGRWLDEIGLTVGVEAAELRVRVWWRLL